MKAMMSQGQRVDLKSKLCCRMVKIISCHEKCVLKWYIRLNKELIGISYSLNLDLGHCYVPRLLKNVPNGTKLPSS